MKSLLTTLVFLCLILAQGCDKETPWADEPEVYPWIDGARMGAPNNPCFPPGKPGGPIIVEDHYLNQPETHLSKGQTENQSESFPWIDKP